LPASSWIGGTGSERWLQRRVPDQFRGRIFGAYGATQGIAQLVGQTFASAAATALGIVVLLDIASTLFLIVGVVTFAMLRHDEAAAPTDLDPSPHHDEAADQRMPAP
jgi:dipeptide/tripeptide permease